MLIIKMLNDTYYAFGSIEDIRSPKYANEGTYFTSLLYISIAVSSNPSDYR